MGNPVHLGVLTGRVNSVGHFFQTSDRFRPKVVICVIQRWMPKDLTEHGNDSITKLPCTVMCFLILQMNGVTFVYNFLQKNYCK